MDRLTELPVLIQSNASFIMRKQSLALRLLRQGQIHLLGSDCHNLTSRSPNMDAAISRIQKHLGPPIFMRMNEIQRDVLGLD